jgi:hypothetical protein
VGVNGFESHVGDGGLRIVGQFDVFVFVIDVFLTVAKIDYEYFIGFLAEAD